jgi:hypothetical protein
LQVDSFDRELGRMVERLQQAQTAVTEVGSRSAIMAVVRASSDAQKLESVDKGLTETLVRLYQVLSLSQAHLQVRAYRAQEESSRKVMQCLDRLGGAAAVVRDEARLRELADELGLRIDEARADLAQVLLDKLDKLEGTLRELQQDGPHSNISHGGAQVFWRSRIGHSFRISPRDLRETLLTHLNLTRPEEGEGEGGDAATEAAKCVLRDEASWRRLAGRLEATQFGTVSATDLGGALEPYQDVSLAKALCQLHESLKTVEEQGAGQPGQTPPAHAPYSAELAVLVERIGEVGERLEQTAEQVARIRDAQYEVNRGLRLLFEVNQGVRLLVQNELDCPRLLLIVKRSGPYAPPPPKSSVYARAVEKAKGLGEGVKNVFSCCYVVLVLCPVCRKVANQDAPYSKRLTREKLRKYAPALRIALAVVKVSRPPARPTGKPTPVTAWLA